MSTQPVTTHAPSVKEPVDMPEPQSLTRERLRAWAWHRQGLDGSLAGCTAEQVLARAGWARSVGGANPYLTLFARAGIRRDHRQVVHLLPQRHHRGIQRRQGITDLPGGLHPD